MSLQNSNTVSGVLAPSRSGQNIGRVCIPEKSLMLTPEGACVRSASSNAVLLDPERVLPEIASMFRL